MLCHLLQDLWFPSDRSVGSDFASFDFLLNHSIDGDCAISGVDSVKIDNDGQYVVLIHSAVLSFYKDQGIIHDIEFDNSLQTVTLDKSGRFILVHTLIYLLSHLLIYFLIHFIV